MGDHEPARVWSTHRSRSDLGYGPDRASLAPAEAMRRLLDDPALALRLAQAARKRVEERYSRQAMVRRFEAFYQDLLWGTDFPCGVQLSSGLSSSTNTKTAGLSRPPTVHMVRSVFAK